MLLRWLLKLKFSRRPARVAQAPDAATRPPPADLKGELGAIALQTQRAHEATALFERAVAARPNNAMAHGNLGSALKDIGRDEDALASYERALHIKPDYAQAHYNRANLL